MNFLNFAQDYFRLRQFYFVAKAGSLTGAAKMLGLTHPTLSESMKILEHRLKTKLLVREGRGMRVTADGERLFLFAEKMFEESETFLKTFIEKGEEIQGEIKILTTPLVGETILTCCLLGFLEKHTDLQIKITTQTTDVDVRDADVAVRTLIPNQLDLEQLLLKTFEIKLWASKTYLDKFGMPNTPECLDNHRVLSYEESKHNIYTNTNWILHVGRKEHKPRKPFYQITSQEGLHHAATKGYGIVQLPEKYVQIKNFHLVEILPNLEGPKIDIYFICPKKLSKSKRITALYNYLKQCFDEL